MKYRILTTHQFEKSLKRCVIRNLKIDKLQKVLSILAEDGSLPMEYRPHKLVGFAGNNTWECHIQPDWLLVWEQHDDLLTLLLINTGSRSDLF